MTTPRKRIPSVCALLAPILLIQLLGTPVEVTGQQAARVDRGTAPKTPSPAAAGALSFTTTAVPTVAGVLIGDEAGFGIAGVGILFGPLAGYAYGEVMERGLTGLGLRAAVGGATAIAVLGLCQLGDCGPYTTEDDGLSLAAFMAVLAGGGVMTASAAIDALSVPGYVRRENEEDTGTGGGEARSGSEAKLSVYPLLRSLGGSRHVGVGVTVRF